MARKQSSAERFAAPAQKYVGKMEVLGGPIPIGQQSRPLTREDKVRSKGMEGTDNRPERPQKQKSPPKGVKSSKGGGG
jgi:hypothetical protein